MKNNLDDLFQKQTLIFDYLVKNYVVSQKDNYNINRIGIPKDFTIKDKWSDELILGTQIEDELKLFYPFGTSVINLVIAEWLKLYGYTKYDGAWDKHHRGKTINVEFASDFDSLGPYGLDELIRVMIMQLSNHLDTERARFSLSNCSNLDDIIATMDIFGYQTIRVIDPTSFRTRIRFIEKEENRHNIQSPIAPPNYERYGNNNFNRQNLF